MNEKTVNSGDMQTDTKVCSVCNGTGLVAVSKLPKTRCVDCGYVFAGDLTCEFCGGRCVVVEDHNG